MFAQLKKISMKSVRNRLIACTVLIVILLAIFGSSFYKLMKGPEALFSLPVDELKNSYVTDNIDLLVDGFAEYYVENEDGSEDITKNYYIVPIGEKEYFALEVSSKDFAIAKQICDETYEYIMGDRETLTTTMKVTGTVSEMDDETYDFYMDWFEDSGFIEDTDNIERIALPYVLKVDHIGYFDTIIVYIALAAIGIILLYAVIILIKGITGMYLSSVKKYIKDNENTLNIERLESDFETAVPVQNVRIGEGWFYFFKGNSAKILNNSDIVWAYLEEITHKTNGIKTGVTKSLIIYTKLKKKYTISMKSSSNVNSVLNVFIQNQPHIVVGFSDDLKKCFHKDFDTFVNIPYMSETAASDESMDER